MWKKGSLVWSRGQDSRSFGGAEGVRRLGPRGRSTEGQREDDQSGRGKSEMRQKNPEFIYEVSSARAKNKPRLYLHGVRRLAE